ncbi:2,3-bisphosphoglycerate-independent phosphoglycerate mutase [Tepidimicrobium xylanilyticum]|uniref:2,3-bisphosphoglycerate-independent phosphoglycerate mutase n=1 Tax=Tepidimicrobium xylanilyticum TaxID=1123352 RepID=A0A1H3A0T4_9FIRM|nr:2,3-bisphosphoglycerate-independent phosphoglycerate mutase [Tepidimicrobium xylanilyticum]GMG96350.1 2,3-bisphosphoglycerate-independent phosphoglycerate mutase [Tepidimicrobium xylanilyticum]SDX23236.1 phosphoglycerate mutase [Tepidimicrobium xylanilyticum]
MNKKPVMLIVLDGWGLGDEYEGNAIYLAKTPNFDRLLKEYPNTRLSASGLAVGLPEGQMGNSEVGHLNIGSGRIIYQELTKITKSIEDGSFFAKEEFLSAIDNAKKNGSKLHIMGLVSDGGVHSHNTHLYALLELCKREGFGDVYIHAFLDGRDVPPTIGKQHLTELKEEIDRIGVGKIATVSGRYYAMDRDKRWERTKLAYDAMVLGLGKNDTCPIEAVEKSYNEGINDEFVIPTVILENGKPMATIDNGDSIIFFNFRPDRARQITRAIVDEDFDGFNRDKRVDTFFVTMTEYDKTIKNVNVVFKTEKPENTLGEYVSNLSLNQLRIAETEKYAHVTFFFNGGREEPYKNEDRVLIPSPKVATYDLKPEMSAIEVKDEVLNRLKMDKYDLIILNFANPDMVGHTGVVEAAIKAVETVDSCLGEIVDLLLEIGGKAIITADHGNAEMMKDKSNGKPITAHTTNMVPLILVGDKNMSLREGILADIAPTILDLMGLEKPEEMTGESLIIKN